MQVPHESRTTSHEPRSVVRKWPDRLGSDQRGAGPLPLRPVGGPYRRYRLRVCILYRRVDREVDAEAGSFAEAALDFDAAAVLVYDLLHDGQPQAGALGAGGD